MNTSSDDVTMVGDERLRYVVVQPWYQQLDLPWVRHLCAIEARWLQMALMHRMHHCVLQMGPLDLKGFSGLHALPWLHFMPVYAKDGPLPDAYVHPACLPLKEDTLSAVVLWHVHDWYDSPMALWQEALRVLEPGGHLILIGFQARSMLSLQRDWTQRYAIKPVHEHALHQWATSVALKMIFKTHFAFRPWCSDMRMFAKRSYVEAWGHLFAPSWGSVHCHVYCKTKHAPIPVGLIRCPIKGLQGHG